MGRRKGSSNSYKVKMPTVNKLVKTYVRSDRGEIGKIVKRSYGVYWIEFEDGGILLLDRNQFYIE